MQQQFPRFRTPQSPSIASLIWLCQFLRRVPRHAEVSQRVLIGVSRASQGVILGFGRGGCTGRLSIVLGSVFLSRTLAGLSEASHSPLSALRMCCRRSFTGSSPEQ